MDPPRRVVRTAHGQDGARWRDSLSARPGIDPAKPDRPPHIAARRPAGGGHPIASIMAVSHCKRGSPESYDQFSELHIPWVIDSLNNGLIRAPSHFM
jgi:hypothetical protein